MAEVTAKPVVEIKDVSKVYQGPAGDIHALRGVKPDGGRRRVHWCAWPFGQRQINLAECTHRHRPSYIGSDHDCRAGPCGS